MWCVHTVEYHSVTNSHKAHRCCNMDEPWKLCPVKGVGHKRSVLHEAVYLRCPEQANVEGESRWVFAWTGIRGGWEVRARRAEFLLGEDENVPDLIQWWLHILRICTDHWIAHSNGRIVCGSCLNKAVPKKSGGKRSIIVLFSPWDIKLDRNNLCIQVLHKSIN